MSEAKIDEKRLAEIEARLRRAAPGPWSFVEHPDGDSIRTQEDEEVADLSYGDSEKDGPFIAHARTDIPDLIAALRAERAEAARIFGQHGELQTLLGAALARGDGLADELRTARAEVERLYGENLKMKAEVARHEDADVARAVRAMGPSWQCSACGDVYRGHLKRRCQACGREGYYSGGVQSELLAKYDAEQAKRIRARGGES